jgi:prevent-host-death family protein
VTEFLAFVKPVYICGSFCLMTMVNDYGIMNYRYQGLPIMIKKTKEIAAGEFKAKCLKLMDEVQISKTPLVVTKHGKPIVTILPFDEKKPFPFGYMRGQISIKGDIVGPTGEKWNAETD